MALRWASVGGFPFEQSREAKQNINHNPRVETASLIVSMDGTGDFEVIQDAINSLEDGGFIQIKEGTYTITETITVPSNIVLSGVGQRSKLLGSSITTLMEITGDDVKIERLGFEGENTSDDGILINSAAREDIIIRDSFFKTLAVGIKTKASYSLYVGNKFEETTTGIELLQGQNSSVYGNIFNYNVGGTDMITSEGVEFMSITGNAGNASGHGYEGDSGDYKIQITGNNFGEDANIDVEGDETLVVGNISGTITDNGTNSVIANNN